MRTLFFIALLLTHLSFRAQFYFAGFQSAGYSDIVPDKLINYTPTTSTPQVFSIDINGDNLYDIEFDAPYGGGLGAGSKHVSIKSLNAGVFISFGRVDSVYHNYFNYWIVSNVAKQLSFGDTINSSTATWDNSLLYLIRNDYSSGTFLSVNDWLSSTDKYVGIKLVTASDTSFGWIRVQCPAANQCYVKDYSFGKCTNVPFPIVSSDSTLCSGESATLSVGGANSYSWSTGEQTPSIVISPSVTETYSLIASLNGCTVSSIFTQSVSACIGIPEYEKDRIKLYPNPVKDVLFFEADVSIQPIDIEITNCLNQTVFKQIYSKKIDVSELPSGLYFLKLNYDLGNSKAKKFLKE